MAEGLFCFILTLLQFLFKYQLPIAHKTVFYFLLKVAELSFPMFNIALCLKQ